MKTRSKKELKNKLKKLKKEKNEIEYIYTIQNIYDSSLKKYMGYINDLLR